MEDRKKFVGYLATLNNLRPELLEKDLLLHLILLKLKETNFLNNYLFKGGSCLIKCYLGYYRFSVDLDFSFKHQKYFLGKSQKQIRRFLSSEINSLKIFEKIAKQINMGFRMEKNNKKYFEFGGSNKMVTLKLWYDSILGTEEFIKIQINFVDRVLFRTRNVLVKSLCPENKKLALLFPILYKLYSRHFRVESYDVKEILCEKIRAILTRKALKERDLIDVYLLVTRFNLSLQALEQQVIEKTRFIMGLYEKYRKNLKEQLLAIQGFRMRKDEYLLINPLDSDFEIFLEDLKKYLLKIGRKLIHEK